MSAKAVADAIPKRSSFSKMDEQMAQARALRGKAGDGGAPAKPEGWVAGRQRLSSGGDAKALWQAEQARRRSSFEAPAEGGIRTTALSGPPPRAPPPAEDPVARTHKRVAQKMQEYMAQKGLRITDIYRSLDTDGDGELTSEEFYVGCRILGISMPRPECNALFGALDTDSTGFLTPVDFSKLAGVAVAPTSRNTRTEAVDIFARRPPPRMMAPPIKKPN